MISQLGHIRHLLIVANIYNKPDAHFSSYDGCVSVSCGSQQIEVPLNEDKKGAWCVIAHIDHSGTHPKVVNLNQVQSNTPNFNMLTV